MKLRATLWLALALALLAIPAGSARFGATPLIDLGWELVLPDLPARIWRSPHYATDHALYLTTDRDLRRTTDDGDTWTTLYQAPAGATEGALTAMAVDPAPGTQTLFVSRNVGAFHPAEILRSTDGGLTWTAVLTVTDSPIYDVVAARDRLNRLTVFALGWSSVWRSEDGGETWVLKQEGLPADADLYRLYVSPIYAADRTLYVTGFGPLYRSTDSGDTWAQVDIPWADVTRHLVFSPNYAIDGTLWASYFWIEGSGEQDYPPNGVVRSTDRGLTWQKVNGGLPVDYLDGWILGLAISPDYPTDPSLYLVERTLQHAGTTWELYRSPAGGDGWWGQGPASDAIPTGLLAVRRDLFFLSTQGGLWRLRNDCWEWAVNGGGEADTGWTMGGLVPAAYTTAQAHSGARAIRVGIIAPPDRYAYSSARQRVALPAHAVSATLSLWLHPVSTETRLAPLPALERALSGAAPPSAPAAGDAQYALITDEKGVTLKRLLWIRRDTTTWEPYTFDLSDYAGQTIWLHFGVYNDGAGGFTGMYVDDVSLRAREALPLPPAPAPRANPGAIGEDFLVSDAPSAQYDPAVAFNPDDDEFLLVWEDFRGAGLPDIYAQRVSSDGRLLGNPMPLVADSYIQTAPQVVYLQSAGRYLVVWLDSRNVVETPDVFGQLVGRDGAPVGGNFAIAAYDGGQVSVRLAASDADDSWLVIWGNATDDGTSRVQGQRVGSDGSLLGARFDLSAGSAWTGQPGLAYSPAAGAYVAVWIDNRAGAGDTDVYAQRVAANGALVGSNFLVTGNPALQEWPGVAINAAGDTLLAIWEDWRAGQRDIYGRQLALDGTPLAPDFAIAAAPGNEEMAVVTTWATAERDEFLVLWQAPFDAGGLHARRIAPGGGLLGDPLVVSDEPHTQANPVVAVAATAPEPAYLVAWEDYRASNNAGLYAQRLDPDGTHLGLHAGLSPLDGSQTRPALAYGETADRYLVAWEGHVGGSASLMAYTVTGDGRLASRPVTLTIGTSAAAPAVAWDPVNDRFLVVWEDLKPASADDFDVFGQLVAADGTLVSGTLTVSDAPDQQHAPALAFGADRYLVVFESVNAVTLTTNVRGQFLAPDGTSLVTATDVNLPITTHTATDRRAERPHLAYDPTGDAFQVVWQDNRDGVGLSIWDVYGRVIAAVDGAPLGPEFVVADELGHNEHGPRVVSRGDATLVVWEDVDMEADGDPDVFGRLLGLDGAPLAPPLPIAADAHWEGAPDVAYNRDAGRFLVAWYDGEQGGTAFLPDIYARQLGRDGRPETGPLPIAADPYSGRFWAVVAARQGHDEWLVAWEDGRADRGAARLGVYARRQAALQLVYLPLVTKE